MYVYVCVCVDYLMKLLSNTGYIEILAISRHITYDIYKGMSLLKAILAPYRQNSECLQPLSSESFVSQFAIQKYGD